MGLYWDNGKEHGNYYIMGYILELHWDNGKENGNYYIMGTVLELYMGIMEKEMGTAIICWTYISEHIRDAQRLNAHDKDGTPKGS